MLEILKSIPIDIWVAFIGLITVFYASPSFVSKRKRELLEIKLKNIYTPFRIVFSSYFLLDEDTFLSKLRSTSESVMNNYYMYCPEKLIIHMSNLLDTKLPEEKIINSYEEIVKIVMYEEYYCQKTLKFNEFYTEYKLEYGTFGYCFYKFYDSMFPIFVISLFIALGVLLVEIILKTNFIESWILLILPISFFFCSIIDSLLSRKTIKGKISQQGKIESKSTPSK